MINIFKGFFFFSSLHICLHVRKRVEYKACVYKWCSWDRGWEWTETDLQRSYCDFPKLLVSEMISIEEGIHVIYN